MINGVVETKTKSKMGEGRGKVVHRVIKMPPKFKVGEERRKMVDWFSEPLRSL